MTKPGSRRFTSNVKYRTLLLSCRHTREFQATELKAILQNRAENPIWCVRCQKYMKPDKHVPTIGIRCAGPEGSSCRFSKIIGQAPILAERAAARHRRFNRSHTVVFFIDGREWKRQGPDPARDVPLPVDVPPF